MPLGPVAGCDAKLYYDSADSIPTPVWVQIANIKDVAEPDSPDKLDVSTRASRNKKYWSGMVDQAITTQYQYQKGVTDTVFTALKAKKESGDQIQLAAADGPIATIGTTYFKDWYVITKFDRKEDLGGTIIFDLEFAPAPKFNSGALVDRSYVTVTV